MNETIYDRPMYFNFGIERLIDDDENYEIHDEDFYLHNYGLTQDTIPFVKEIDYTSAMSLLKNYFPADYFSKFCNLTCVKAEGTLDQAKFSWFLKSLNGNLKKLWLHYCGLNQTFYNELAVSFKFITDFTLFESKEIVLNYNFIAEFERLDKITIDQDMLFASVKTLIHSFSEILFAELFFNYKRINFRLNKRITGHNVLYLFSSEENCFVCINCDVDEILSYLDKFDPVPILMKSPFIDEKYFLGDLVEYLNI